MKWLLPAALLMHTATQAQQVDPETEKLNLLEVELENREKALTVEDEKYKFLYALNSLRYDSGYVLAHPAGLYRSLKDARRGKPAFRLQLGAEVFLVEENEGAQWLRVARDTYTTKYGPGLTTDTTIYYLRASAVRSKSGLRRGFRLH